LNSFILKAFIFGFNNKKNKQTILDESNAIDLNKCFFCEHMSDSAENKCVHMAKEHSFFIPDMEHVSDLEGLIKFLGVKLGAYHVCLWCSTKFYKDLASVQKHMQDKGHQKLKFEGETLLEYADFYSYEGDDTLDEYDVVEDEEMLVDTSIVSTLNSKMNKPNNELEFGDEVFELVLPSGARIGHRSLFKYYKQSFGHRNLEMKQKSNLTLKDKYKAISMGNTYNSKSLFVFFFFI
jgi:pre-60S factor REI1